MVEKLFWLSKTVVSQQRQQKNIKNYFYHSPAKHGLLFHTDPLPAECLQKNSRPAMNMNKHQTSGI